MPRSIAVLMALFVALPSPGQAQVLTSDGGIEIAELRMRCPNEAVALDASLPMEGMYAPGQGIILNPELLKDQPVVVRRFIFAHECAHATVDGDELAADCAAARQGARERWLTQDGITAVCRDFGEHVADEDHPSGRIRCENVRRCFAGAAPANAVVATRASSWKAQSFAAAPSPPWAAKLLRAAKTWRTALQ